MKDSVLYCDMLSEREIDPNWADLTCNDPDKIEKHADGTWHYIKKIAERDNRYLRVIINIEAEPPMRITVFFDRRLRKKHESQI